MATSSITKNSQILSDYYSQQQAQKQVSARDTQSKIEFKKDVQQARASTLEARKINEQNRSTRIDVAKQAESTKVEISQQAKELSKKNVVTRQVEQQAQTYTSKVNKVEPDIETSQSVNTRTDTAVTGVKQSFSSADIEKQRTVERNTQVENTRAKVEAQKQKDEREQVSIQSDKKEQEYRNVQNLSVLENQKKHNVSLFA